jgi:hypothetical protein
LEIFFLGQAKTEGDAPLNLFGDPVQAVCRGRGRPEHVWTLERSNTVLLAIAARKTKREAATAIGISVRTLEKHYFRELEWRHQAELRFEMRQMVRLNAQAEEGNVGAEKELRKMLEAARRESAAVAFRDKPAKPAPIGKKEQRLADAATAHVESSWGDLVEGAEQRPN